MQGQQREIINGKPHFGLYFGTVLVVHNLDAFDGDYEKNPIFQEYLSQLKVKMNAIPSDLEIRNDKLIVRLPHYSNPLEISGTIALKYIIWGRAFKLMRFITKNTKPKYKKLWICGRRKRVRCK